MANADGRCWKDTLGRKRSFKTHRPPYPTRRGLVTAWQETKKLLHDESGRLCQGGPEGEKYPKTTRTGKATKKTNKKEVWKSLVRASSSAQPTEERKEEEEIDRNNYAFIRMLSYLILRRFPIYHSTSPATYCNSTQVFRATLVVNTQCSLSKIIAIILCVKSYQKKYFNSFLSLYISF